MAKIQPVTVSVVIAVRDEAELLKRCLKSIRKQIFNQKSIEIIIADGSRDGECAAVVKKYVGKIIRDRSGSPETAKGLALENAKGEFVLFLDADNELPTGYWLRKMVFVMEQEKDIVGCYPRRYAYNPEAACLNRYFALIGINDPVAFSFGKADRQSYLSDKWDLSGKVVDKKNYFLVSFDEKTAPTLGANGILVRRKLLAKTNVKPETFFHIDVHLDLIRMGFDSYAAVKNTIIHHEGGNLARYFKKRWRYMTELYLRDLPKRRYLIYDGRKDFQKLVFYLLRSLLIFPDLIIAAKGYYRVPDPAWFLHPVMNLSMIALYGTAVIRNFFQSVLRGKYHSIPSW